MGQGGAPCLSWLAHGDLMTGLDDVLTVVSASAGSRPPLAPLHPCASHAVGVQGGTTASPAGAIALCPQGYGSGDTPIQAPWGGYAARLPHVAGGNRGLSSDALRRLWRRRASGSACAVRIGARGAARPGSPIWVPPARGEGEQSAYLQAKRNPHYPRFKTSSPPTPSRPSVTVTSGAHRASGDTELGS
jgi:hypothetical protein